MPELPEVETIRQSLAKEIKGARLIKTEIFNPTVISISEGIKTGCYIVSDLRRRGKYLLIDLADAANGDDAALLMLHFRMTGKILVQRDLAVEPAKHTHLRFHMHDDSDFYLDFNDVRRFGRVWFLPWHGENLDPGVHNLGPEPLEAAFTVETLTAMLQKHKKSVIKGALLNQTVVAGIGNIYCDEALFLSGIHPARLVESLSADEIARLYTAIRKVVADGIGHGGTSFRDYVNALGQKGSFQQELMVFRREGEKCRVCGTVIERSLVCGRGTHFCPHCQK